MTVDLRRVDGEEFNLPTLGWALLLNLAQRYGWQSAGTQLEDPNWDGCYDANAGQWISPVDAAQMAAALVRATEDPRISSVSSRLAIQVASTIGVPVDLNWFDADNARLLAAFLSEGSVQIN